MENEIIESWIKSQIEENNVWFDDGKDYSYFLIDGRVNLLALLQQNNDQIRRDMDKEKRDEIEEIKGAYRSLLQQNNQRICEMIESRLARLNVHTLLEYEPDMLRGFGAVGQYLVSLEQVLAIIKGEKGE